ncbi:MAG TPA: MFS transporter [Candidatus Margulisiibacteriota bacterium]|nr:MFS transporter [Candidatus Margulisiibacteriota bacterium]
MFNIILLGITSLLTDISSEMVYPILPLYLVTVLGAGPAVLGFIEGIAESTASLTKVFSGYFSDKTKSRKPFTILGYSGSAVGKLLLFLSVNWWFVLFGRTVDRLGKGIRTAPRDALIAESARADKRGAAFGIHRAMDTLGAAIGVLLAYFLVTRYKGNFKNIFMFSLLPALAAVFFLFFVRERKKPMLSGGERIRLKWRSLDKRLKLFLIFTFIFTLGNSSNQFLLLRAKDLGNPIATVILLYLVYNLVYALVSYPAARLSDKIGRKKILVLGYLFYGLVYLGFAQAKPGFNLWLLFGLYGLYIGFTEGVEKALLTDISPLDLRATTIGLHATLVGIGLLPASLFAGFLWKFFGASAPFYFGGFMGILASLGFWVVLKEL